MFFVGIYRECYSLCVRHVTAILLVRRGAINPCVHGEPYRRTPDLRVLPPSYMKESHASQVTFAWAESDISSYAEAMQKI